MECELRPGAWGGGLRPGERRPAHRLPPRFPAKGARVGATMAQARCTCPRFAEEVLGRGASLERAADTTMTGIRLGGAGRPVRMGHHWLLRRETRTGAPTMVRGGQAWRATVRGGCARCADGGPGWSWGGGLARGDPWPGWFK
jgi:hypothetical protein